MEKVENYSNDQEYLNIVADILNNDKFLKLQNCRHHGGDRLEHSLRVSYYSYLITKKLKLNYIETARGGLLHDFFFREELSLKKQKFCFALHPYNAIENANNYFNLTDLERDIIINHMFPTLPHKVPKYIESWIVSLVDKASAIYELKYSYKLKLIYRFSHLYIMLLLFK